MTQPFDEPAPTTGVLMPPKEIVGNLLLVWAVDYIADSPTKYSRPDKPSDVIIVDVVNLDWLDEPTGQYGVLGQRIWWRNAKLIQALRPRIDSPRPMLAWMVQGVATMGNPPFELRSATQDPEAVARGSKWLVEHPNFVKSERWKQQDPTAAPVSPPVSTTVNTAAHAQGTLQRMAAQADRGAARLMGQTPPPPPYPPQSPEAPF